MNMKEKLAALVKQAQEIMPKVKAGDPAALAKATELADEIENLKAAIAQADAFEATLSGIGSAGKSAGSAGVDARSLGEFAAKAVEGLGLKSGARFSHDLGMYVKANTDTHIRPEDVIDATAEVREELVTGPRRRLVVADLFGQETTTRGAVTYFVEGASEGDAGTSAEGESLPQIHFADPTPQTDKVQKVSGVLKESDEIVEDLPWLASAINNRGIYMVQLAEENQLVSGDGSGTNIKGVLNRDGVLTEQTAAGEENVADALFRATTKISTNSPFEADGIVINPTDYETLRLAKDGNKQYFGGGFFSGAYGNGGIIEKPPIWGLRTVVTPAIAQGTVLVGAFRLGGSVIRRKGLTVEIANQNEDDFVKNRIAIRIAERLALAIRYPKAFCKVTVAAAG